LFLLGGAQAHGAREDRRDEERRAAGEDDGHTHAEQLLAQLGEVSVEHALHGGEAEDAGEDGAEDATDEAQAVEALAARGRCAMPRLVEGSRANFKVTYPDDWAIAEAILVAQRGEPR
ncbi:MAG: 2-C-methyl-D-erythritol 4-phosphate cytidylyltransferase, partial [Burkholderiales bacterium]|nr:2-C-methyl-D-erythritol 4-phosphate cytidylyltransferase [Burkholderiales bacterium]